MSEHLIKPELDGLLGGRLLRAQSRAVILHLLGCEACRTAAAPRLAPFLSVRPPVSPAAELSPDLDAAYATAFDRAIATVLESRDALRERSAVQRALEVYAEEGIAGVEKDPGLLRGLPACQALLQVCQELRYEDPKRMIDTGTLAVHAAGRLSPLRYGAERVADCKCRALVELANAYRVGDRLDDAERTLGEAAQVFGAFNEGTRNELLEARLNDVKASLLADRRRFAEAAGVLDTVYSIYCRHGERHLAGRARISKGIYVGYRGAPEEAIRLLREGLSLLDPERDPALVYGAVHSQAHFLLTCGRPHEARALLWKYPASPEAVGGRMNLLKIRWLAAQIDASAGDLAAASQGFLEAKQGFEDAGLYYKAALVSLEMATVWMRQGRHEEARALVVEVLGMFKVLRIEREALGSLLLMVQAFEGQVATAALIESVESVIELLKRADDDPGDDDPGAHPGLKPWAVCRSPSGTEL